MTDYLERTHKKEQVKSKTMEDKEIEEEMKVLDKEIVYMIDKKMKEFSFEIADEEDYVHFPEEETLQ